MAICRSILYHSSVPRPLQPMRANSTFRSSYRPPRSNKFTALPLFHHKRPVFSCSSLSSSSSMENPPEGYRRNVGICLMNPSDKKIFAASRLDIPNSWQMPQGGVDDCEDPRNAAIRELREETGVTSAEIVEEVPYWLTYDFPPDVRENLKHQWGSEWKGQAQNWSVYWKRCRNQPFGRWTEKAEFGEWAWMSTKQVVDLVSAPFNPEAVDFKKPVYKEGYFCFHSISSISSAKQRVGGDA